MILLRTAQIRRIEAQHQRAFPSDALPLMERAGIAAADVAQSLCSSAAKTLVMAGPGNNGGDAFVLARELKQRGRNVVVHFLGSTEKLPADALSAYRACQGVGVKISAALVPGDYGLIVDGLFGIGLSRWIEGPYAELIAQINAFGGPVLALDVPSGLDGDTGRVHGCAVRASHTVSFIAAKPGLLTLDGPDHCGQLFVDSLDLANLSSDGARMDRSDYQSQLHLRRNNTHKGSHGSLAILGGSAGMIGAAILTARAGLQLGAGRVFVGSSALVSFDPVQPELMMRSADDALLQATTIVVGPGLGLSASALETIQRVTSTNWRDLLPQAIPAVFDADALTLIGAHPVVAKNLLRRTAPTVLTPHPSEAARLLRCDVADIQANRIDSALRLARQFNAVAVLKGCGSVIARPDGCWRINTLGNPGLATGGTGDVLAGFIGALLAQGWPAWEAACAAVQLHGAAADECVSAGLGPIGLTASELIAPARRLLNEWITEQQITTRRV